MILEQQKQAIVLSKGENENTSIKMSLDLDSAQILMQMLSKNLYSDAIGSTIRETASNALDSHRKVDSKEPIIVSLTKNEEDNFEFSVEDFGCGLDNEDVDKILSKYGKSTKRDSNKYLGAMGLGWKSPLAYSSSFYFICRKNGIERKYMMYEGEDVNTIDLLFEAPTEKPNGVKVIVPVKNNSVKEFYTKIKQQLCYFESVYFNVPYLSHLFYDCPAINNSFSILRTENYQISELNEKNEMHICLDNVFYPIDFNSLDIPTIYIPVGLRFSLSDGLFPTPNREQLIYSTETKRIILERIKIVSNELMLQYNEKLAARNFTLMTAIDYYSESNYYLFLNNLQINLAEIQKQASIPANFPVVDGIEYLNIKNIKNNIKYFLDDYKITSTLSYGRMSSIIKYTLKFENVYKHPQHYKLHNVPITNKQKDWFRDNLGDSITYFIKKRERSFFTLFPTTSYHNHNYVDLLELRSIKKKHWRKAIVEFQTAINDVVNSLQFVDDFEVPKVWIEKQKKERTVKTSLLEGEFSCKIAHSLERYVEGQNCKFVATTLQRNSLHKFNSLTIYDLHENKYFLDAFFKPLSGKIRLITVNQKIFNELETLNIHNVISYDTFMKGKNKPFKRLATKIKINQLISNNRTVFRNINTLYSVSSTFKRELDTLDDYVYGFRTPEEEIIKAILEIAESNQLFDYSIYSTYEKIKAKLEKLYFLDFLLNSGHNHQDADRVKVLVDMMKYYKERVDLKNYKLKPILNEEIKEAV